ncbi:MAG: hypothetical protein LBH16_00455 [Treponema sp.]|jgi:hypothetical protein|nr:hypothetical protein [Treponema sp.]
MVSTNSEKLKLTSDRSLVNFAPHSALSAKLFSLFIVHGSLFVVLVVLAILLLSCQSAVQIAGSPPVEAETVPLETGASVYLFANMQQALPILELLPIMKMNAIQAKPVIERTEFTVAALFPQESGRQFQLVTWGNYPDNSARFLFGMSKEWKKRRVKVAHNGTAPYTYWYSSANGLSITLNAKQAFILAAAPEPQAKEPRAQPPAEPVTAPENMAKIPEGFIAFRRSAEEAFISCWFSAPGSIMNRLLSGNGLPIEIPAKELFVNVIPYAAADGNEKTSDPEKYEIIARIQFDSAAQARGVTSILGIAASLSPADSNSVFSLLFLAHPPVRNDRFINIRSAPLGKKEMSLLLGMFLLY